MWWGGGGGGLEVHLHENMKEKVPEDVVVGGGEGFGASFT